jgi:hypothetical protein
VGKAADYRHSSGIDKIIMRQSNRTFEHRTGEHRTGASHKRSGGSEHRNSYRGSYYGSDGYDGASVSHRGRGPKGYVRSDRRLREIICEYLTDDPNIDASDISVEVEDQQVRLSGNIEDKEAKQEVEAIVERIGGVKGIDNRLRAKAVQPRAVLTLLDYDPAMLDGSAATIEGETDPAANCDDRS